MEKKEVQGNFICTPLEYKLVKISDSTNVSESIKEIGKPYFNVTELPEILTSKLYNET